MRLTDFEAPSLDGTPHPLAAHAGEVVLVVNVASQCGFTPQYAGLEALHRAHAAEGFSVLGFPCNQFGGQEPGPAEEIARFCDLRYDVTFPMFAKVDVNGDGAHPLWQWLTDQQRGLLGSRAVKWNFTKFLVGRDGTVLKRYAPGTTPEEIGGDPTFRAALAAPRPETAP
jgi:glutathione peroxidase